MISERTISVDYSVLPIVVHVVLFIVILLPSHPIHCRELGSDHFIQSNKAPTRRRQSYGVANDGPRGTSPEPVSDIGFGVMASLPPHHTIA